VINRQLPAHQFVGVYIGIAISYQQLACVKLFTNILQKPLPAAKPPKPVQKTAKDTSSGGSNEASAKASPEPEEVQPIKSFPEAEQQPETPPPETENGKEELPECDMTCMFEHERRLSFFPILI